MGLAEDYRKQWSLRDWDSMLSALPDVSGHHVLDLGCGPGLQAQALSRRGARVTGLDLNNELLEAARELNLTGSSFCQTDIGRPLEIDEPVDGVWCSFSPAYFVDLPPVLRQWTSPLRKDGWVLMVEVDDMFAHEPVAPRTRELLASFCDDAFDRGRYDFRSGRKLAAHAATAGLSVLEHFTVGDRELCFDGPASPAVMAAWERRLDRMGVLKRFCGGEFSALRSDFLGALSRDDHRTEAAVYACLARKVMD